MRGSKNVDGKTTEPRRSKRQRIDLTSEEGFDRHELERALLKSLEEERSREKEKPNKKSIKPRTDKVFGNKTAARIAPKSRKFEVSATKRGESGKVESGEKKVEQSEQPPSTTRKVIENAPAVHKKAKTEPSIKQKEETSSENSLQSSKSKKQSAVKKRDPSVGKKKEEFAAAEGSSKSENLIVKVANSTEAVDTVSNKEGKEQPEVTTEIDSHKQKPDFDVRRVPPPYRLPSRASDLITLLACAKEVLGDHEYSSDQD